MEKEELASLVTAATITVTSGDKETTINVSLEAVETFNRMFEHQKIAGSFPEKLAKLFQDSLRTFMQDPRFAPPHIAEMLLRMKELDEKLAKLQEATAKSGFSIAEKG